MLLLKEVVTPDEHTAYKAIREGVFVQEQQCPPDIEWDEHDLPGSVCTHLIGLVDGVIVATARWRPVDPSTAKLERFAVVQAWRGKGLGQSLVNQTIDHARLNGFSHLYLHAQAHLERFYYNLGFMPEDNLFYEAGIPHVKMTLPHNSD